MCANLPKSKLRTVMAFTPSWGKANAGILKICGECLKKVSADNVVVSPPGHRSIILCLFIVFNTMVLWSMARTPTHNSNTVYK